MNNEFENNAIFWIEVEKIKPNPYQPRKEFDEHHLRDLAESIRMYGVLQPLVVTRHETPKEDGGMEVDYELIAGERRLRAAKIAGVMKVPALIKIGAENSRVKLELAIIENLQREDLNPVDRAMAFARLANEFELKHVEIAAKVGKSREYVSNTLRLLMLPQDILTALQTGKISEGHARTLMMLVDRKEEQTTLFKEIIFKKLTVREAEQIARHIARERVRKKVSLTPEMEHMEQALAETLGTRVHIEPHQVGGGKILIDYFTPNDLRALLERLQKEAERLPSADDMKTSIMEATPLNLERPPEMDVAKVEEQLPMTAAETPIVEGAEAYDDRSLSEQQAAMETSEEDLYSVKHFNI